MRSNNSLHLNSKTHTCNILIILNFNIQGLRYKMPPQYLEFITLWLMSSLQIKATSPHTPPSSHTFLYSAISMHLLEALILSDILLLDFSDPFCFIHLWTLYPHKFLYCTMDDWVSIIYGGWPHWLGLKKPHIYKLTLPLILALDKSFPKSSFQCL